MALETELQGRASRLVTRCIYEIATGTWGPGEKLPAVRQAEAMWGLDRRLVMKAYRRLSELGLVEARDRSGYYVSVGVSSGRLSRHRHEMGNLYEKISDLILGETDLNVLGAFRYLEQYAEQQARWQPEVAFVECTAAQAEGHAHEVRERLGLPCLPLTLDAIEGKRTRVPTHVRTLLVTGFHYGQLRALKDEDLRVESVPIGVCPDIATRLQEGVADVVIVEYDETEGEHIARDVEALDERLKTRLCVTRDVDATLDTMFETAPTATGGKVVALSPRVWGDATERWREHPDVALVEFRIVDEAWSRIADAIGLPLGDLG